MNNKKYALGLDFGTLSVRALLVNLENATSSLAEIVKDAEKLGDKIGVKIILQHEEIFDTMYRV